MNPRCRAPRHVTNSIEKKRNPGCRSQSQKTNRSVCKDQRNESLNIYIYIYIYIYNYIYIYRGIYIYIYIYIQYLSIFTNKHYFFVLVCFVKTNIYYRCRPPKNKLAPTVLHIAPTYQFCAIYEFSTHCPLTESTVVRYVSHR